MGFRDARLSLPWELLEESPFSPGWCSVSLLLHEELQQGRRGLQWLEATMQDSKMKLTS